MVMGLESLLHSFCFVAPKRCRVMRLDLTPKARQYRCLRSILIAGMVCSPIHVQAAGSSGHHDRQSAGVVMMVGGMTNPDDNAPLSQTQQTVAPVTSPSQSDEASRLSVIIESGRSLPNSPATPTPSTVSRVMALAPMVDEIARTAGMDSALLLAVIDVESGGNPLAMSPKGAAGLMQLMPDTGARHGASNLFDPRQNISAGAHYLRQLMQQFGDLQLALAAYNAGEGAVQKYGGQIPPYAETMNYVPRVMGRYLHYRNTGDSMRGIVSGGAADAIQGRFLVVRQNGTTSD